MIRYGILGCGGHALQSHALPGTLVKEMKLTAICDVNPRSMDSFMPEFGERVQRFTNEQDFFKSGIDAVIVSTPDEFHINNMGAAINARKHMLIEKPLANTKAELITLRHLLNSAKQEKLVVTSCHPRRFDDPFLWLKKETPRLTSELGRVVNFEFWFEYHRPTAEWKHKRSLMLDHLNHEIDLLHFLYGHNPFKAVRDTDSFDHYQVTGSRQDGIGFCFHGSRKREERVFHEWVKINHEHGQVIVSTDTGKADITHNDGRVVVEACGRTNYFQRGYGVMQNFADTILGNAENYLLPEDLWINNWLGVYLATTSFAKTSTEAK